MQNAFRLQKNERLDICKNVKDQGQLFSNVIYPLYREEIFQKKFLITAKPDGSWNLFQGDRFQKPIAKNIIAQDGIYILSFTDKNGEEEIIYCGISCATMQYRLYRWFKEVYNMSRHDENHPAANKFREYINTKQAFQLNMYFTPVIYPNLLKGKKQVFDFLTEIKKMFISEFSPSLNEYFVNETVDESEF